MVGGRAGDGARAPRRPRGLGPRDRWAALDHSALGARDAVDPAVGAALSGRRRRATCRARVGALHVALGSVFIVLTNARDPATGCASSGAEGGGLGALVRSTMQGVAEYYPPALVVYGVIVAIGHFVYPATGDGCATLRRGPSGARMPSRSPIAEATCGRRQSAPSAAAVAPIDGHITVRQWNRVHLVRVEDIDFVEAEDNYVVVHAASSAYKGRDRISDVESQLDARRFVRIHRSTIVHVAKIREVQPLTHGDHAVILRDGKVLRVARSRRQALERR